MNKINNLRAELIYTQYGSGNCSTVMTDVLKMFLKNRLSITENGECDRKGCLSKEHELLIPVVSISKSVFENKMVNLKSAILDNFPDESHCHKCRSTLINFQREYGHHLFVKVSDTK